MATINTGKAEMGCCWHFAEQLGGADVGPNDPMSENFKKTPYASLIRESVQNLLDAVKDTTKPVNHSFGYVVYDFRKFHACRICCKYKD